MIDYIIIGLLVTAIVLLIVILAKSSAKAGSTDIAKEIVRSKSELGNQLSSVKDAVFEQRTAILREQLEQQNRLNKTLTDAVSQLQSSNERKLEQMRMTVDEKLSDTLSKRLDSSFKSVSEQLEKVYISLGKMQDLSSGVTDLQRLLTNVKARGTWAEVRLGEILEQVLTNDQFERNISIKNNSERVEFAVKIPSKDNPEETIYLPIDSKFPQEDYLRIQQAAENADKAAVTEYGKALEKIIRSEAATISKLYIDVPKTTDFAIMFLPTEGLYAEVLRRQGLIEELQSRYRIMICGPTTITAFLNTLRIGFRTIALDKRAAEVWKVLGATKQQYDKFSDILAKAKRKIDEAGNVLDDAQKRNTTIRRKLNGVEDLPADDADALLNSLPDSFE